MAAVLSLTADNEVVAVEDLPGGGSSMRSLGSLDEVVADPGRIPPGAVFDADGERIEVLYSSAVRAFNGGNTALAAALAGRAIARLERLPFLSRCLPTHAVAVLVEMRERGGL